VPGILSPVKITVKGAPAARRLLRNRRPLSSDLPRQVLGTYRKDGAERGDLLRYESEFIEVIARHSVDLGPIMAGLSAQDWNKSNIIDWSMTSPENEGGLHVGRQSTHPSTQRSMT